MTFFLGIDPGKYGAFGLVSAAGRVVSVQDMPICVCKATGHYDIPAIYALLRGTLILPGVRVIMEWPNTRPGEGAQRSRNFGLGMGFVAMALVALRADWERVDPQRWKNRLGLPGKKDPQAIPLARSLYDTYFPDQGGLLLGPRGGLKDGRLEAVLIAEYRRRTTYQGMKGTADRFGPGSAEAMAMVLGAGRRRKSRK